MYEVMGSDVFVKRSEDPRVAAALEAEGDMLRLAAHPGVVEVVRSEAIEEGWELVLRRVSGSDLAHQQPWTAEEVAGFGAAAATTLADLHDLGVVHGRIGPEHLLVDESGRALFCGFSQARRSLGDSAGEGRKAADVVDLARCLMGKVPAGAPRALHRALSRGMADSRRPVTARQLARALGQSVEGAALPMPPTVPQADDAVNAVNAVDTGDAKGAVGEGVAAAQRMPGAGDAERRTGTAARATAVGAVLMALAVALLLVAGWSGRPVSRPPSSLRSPPRTTSATCPAVDDGCRPVAMPGGFLTLARGRYRIGEATDVLVLGRWTCSAVALPALLRPTGGQVWAFGRWAEPGRESTATLLGRVAGARSLRVLPGVDGCDRVEVLRRVGPPVVVGWPHPLGSPAEGVVAGGSGR